MTADVRRLLRVDNHSSANHRPMIKNTAKIIARNFGVNLYSNDRLGVDLETDLSRLTTYDPIKCIFDVGGNFGQTAIKFATAFPAASIFTFEPVPQTFHRLQSEVGGYDRIKPFNIALGDKAGTAAMHLTEGAGSNTILQNTTAVGSIDISIDTLDSFATANMVSVIDLLKIDVEGYELQVLKGAKQFLERAAIRYIFAECVLSEDKQTPHTNFFALHEVLDRLGFCFVTYYAEAFRLDDGCALGNVLYALRSKLPRKVSGRTANVA